MSMFLKNRRFKTKKNNKGFSLVEVLCAVVLLAIVATPILQAIYSGMTLNIKSRKLLSAADLAAGYTEYVSSLVFDDFSYTEGGTTYTIKGYKSKYYNAPAGSSFVYPSGPVGIYGTATGTTTRTLDITDINFDGFKYDLKVISKEPSSASSEVYYTYDIEVRVYEHGKSTVLATSNTSIANKY